MRYVAAYCLFALSGKTPTAKDLEKMLGSVGVDCDAALAKKVVSELEGKDLEALIREGMGKLGSVPAGSGGGGGSVAAPSAGGGGSAAVKEEPKEEKKEEPEEESDDDMGFGLFD